MSKQFLHEAPQSEIDEMIKEGMKEFVASFVDSVQVTEDSWVKTRPSLKVNANTTIGDIHEWWKKHKRMGIMEIEIYELQTVEDGEK